MEFEQLKSSLENEIKPVYMINGSDGFLTHKALSMIENALCLSMPEMNKSVFGDDYVGGAGEIVSCCEALPFVDNMRLVVCYDYVGKKNDSEKSVFLGYIKSPNPHTCLVFFSSTKSDFFSSFETKVENISCDKVSDSFLQKFITSKCERLGIKIDFRTISHLIDYCNHSLTKIDTEIDKLSSIIDSDSMTIRYEDVDEFVTKDMEYVIFDLTGAISRKNSDRVYEIIDDMLKNKNQPISIISLLSNHFRRLFFVSRSSDNDAKLAGFLGVKEYAVKKYREQTALFSVKKLKSIFDECAHVEYLCKSGQMAGKNALFFLIGKILAT